MDMNTIIEGVVIEKFCTIKADKDSNDVKRINLRVRFDGTSLQSVFDKAMSSAVIQWQNGPGRNNFDKWEDDQTVEVSFKAPGRTQVDPEQAMIAKLKGMTSEEQIAYLKGLAEKVK